MNQNTVQIKKLVAKAEMRNAMLTLKEAAPEAWEYFLTQFLKDTHVVPPVFHQDIQRVDRAEHSRRIGYSYLKLLAEDDPQSIINRIEAQ